MSLTYELRILFLEKDPEQIKSTKDDVKNWLLGEGEETIVEGVLDNLDVDLNHNRLDHEHYGLLGGETAPVSIYSYDPAHIRRLRQGLEAAFGGRLQCEEHSVDTQVWQEGWKQSFKPIETDKFYIYPPWEAGSVPSNKMAIEIDPGMAFGTGQHETTRLCLKQLEKYASLTENNALGKKRALDVGTGSGILAIAAKKMGFATVVGTDIDEDALKSAGDNTKANAVDVTYHVGSFPSDEGYDLVLANILGTVLRKLAPYLAKMPKTGGTLIMSGLLAEERQQMIQCYEPLGFKMEEYETLGDWLVIRFRRL